ncbi:MAG: BamA/TamA family outer membrane protein [Myxococcales bacterium]|nr:MAG: BamA/TamA family outer membrane protein [Myxococcales bacterium]
MRDDPQRPHGGAFLQLTLNEAGFFLPSDWDYVRALTDARVYLPLPWRITLAAKFALGMLFIDRAASRLDPLSQGLGPRDYRLRGGGASSNRGYLPGRLGDGLEGGTRRWEASLELRVPLLNDFGVVLFSDRGDVSRKEHFRFDHPQTSAGFGLRYFTLVGALRADFAWQLPGLQVLAKTDQRISDLDSDAKPRTRGGPFVFHLTIGQAF